MFVFVALFWHKSRKCCQFALSTIIFSHLDALPIPDRRGAHEPNAATLMNFPS